MGLASIVDYFIVKAIINAAKEAGEDDEHTSDDKPENKSPQGASRQGALNEAKRQNRVPTSQSPEKQSPNRDKRGEKQPGREYKYRDVDGNEVTIRDDAVGHQYKDDPSQNRGPHFNDEAGRHYDY